MNYTIKLEMNIDGSALQVLLRTLDAGPHGLMRGMIDNIIQQAQAQENEARAKAEAAPTDVVDGMPVSPLPN
jgi:hypothetical protein